MSKKDLILWLEVIEQQVELMKSEIAEGGLPAGVSRHGAVYVFSNNNTECYLHIVENPDDHPDHRLSFRVIPDENSKCTIVNIRDSHLRVLRDIVNRACEAAGV